MLKTGVNNINISDVSLPDDWCNSYEIRTYIWNSLTELKPVLFKTNEDRIPTIYVVGDSTVADYKAEKYPYTGWGSEFKNKINDKKASVVNMAMADCSSKEFVSQNLNKLKNCISPSDYVFISFGFDDAAKNTSEEDYKKSIRAIAEVSARNGAEVVIITAPDFKNENVNPYNAYLKEVATELGVVVLDLNAVWSEFMEKTSNDELFYGTVSDVALKNDWRWMVSELNPDSDNYNSGNVVKDGRFSPEGARKAADIVVKQISESDMLIKNAVREEDVFSYSVENGVLSVSGKGKLPVFASFDETPWKSQVGNVTEIKISDGVESISSDAFSGFTSLKAVYIPESVETICAEAFPENVSFTVWGYYKSAAQHFAENNPQLKFSLIKLRIMTVGNSHTADYLQWKDNIFSDLKNAGLATTVEFSDCLVGAAQMYFEDYKYAGENSRKSHYLQGSNPNSPKYSTSQYVKLRDGKYDLVLIQDFRESIMEKYAESFPDAISNVMRWLRNEHPNADIAWVADWSDVGSADALSDRAKMKTQWTTYGAPMIARVEGLEKDKPDFIVPMGTALQNARSSYLGGVYNAADCYTNTSDTDWAQPEYITNYTVLERDSTHCSYELGRYLVGTTVFYKVFSQYKDILGGINENFDYFSALATMPSTTGRRLWQGEVTQSAMNIICESAKNAVKFPTVVTDSVYTNDPADEMAAEIQKLTFSSMSVQDIVTAVNNANLGITIETDNVTIDAEDSTKASVKFLYGYTEKVVNVSKNN